jgi:hypothetical protein
VWCLVGPTACGIVCEAMPEHKAEAALPRHDHTHDEPGTPHHSEISTTLTTVTTTTPPPNSGVSWDWNPNTERFEPRDSGPHVWNPKPKTTTRADAPLVLIYDRWSGEPVAEVFEPLLWARGCPIFDSG